MSIDFKKFWILLIEKEQERIEGVSVGREGPFRVG